jgi:hypothetical protein
VDFLAAEAADGVVDASDCVLGGAAPGCQRGGSAGSATLMAADPTASPPTAARSTGGSNVAIFATSVAGPFTSHPISGAIPWEPD